MLKSLLGRIKSEKTSSVVSKKDSSEQVQEHNTIEKDTESYQFKPLDQINLVQCHMQKIRYSVEPEAPKVYTRILACPISIFNVLPYGKRKVKEIDLKEHPCPSYINQLKDILNKELPTYNHLLINVYPPGVGIMPHFDGPMYRSKVVVLSLGGPSIINFTSSYSNSSYIASVLLEDQSVHIFEGQAYQGCLHGIKEYTIDSIFLKIGKRSVENIYAIEKASVCNFSQTRLCSLILGLFNNCGEKAGSQQSNHRLSGQYGVSLNLIPIEGNESFNFKLQLTRKERISITVRQKFS